jgi:hypothetical protein
MKVCWIGPSNLRCYVPPGLRAGGPIVALGGLWRRKEALVATTTERIRSAAEELLDGSAA